MSQYVASMFDHDYQHMERLIARRVSEATGPLFETDAAGLWEAYLGGIPADQRQHYNCHACRRFIERYGGLGTIDLGGNLHPAMPWDTFRQSDFPAFFGQSAINMCQRIIGTLPGRSPARVTGVFLSSEPVWGSPRTGDWTHMHGMNPRLFQEKVKTASQAMAEKREEHHMLCRGLAEVPREAVVQAVRVLESGHVGQEEKTLPIARWLLDLHDRIADLRGRQRDNVIWLAVAQAPPGWCHVRSTMISTLLDDVMAGLPFESIRRRWREKMHPLQYQRPTAPPTAGLIKQANELVEKLGCRKSLDRRFARLSDVLAFEWRPPLEKPEKPAEPDTPTGGAFDHLLIGRGRTIKPVDLPAQRIGWERFRAEVLIGARKVEVLLGHGRLSLYGLVTAVDPEAPNLLQWDNPVSWFFMHGGAPAAAWGLSPGWCEVAAIFLGPNQWVDPAAFPHQGHNVFFALKGVRVTYHDLGGGLFPEMMRSEFHGIRKAVEAHSNAAEIAGNDDGNASGIALSDCLRVRVDGVEYNLTK